MAGDERYARVDLRNRPWARNINSSQFGASMFAMTDPIFPLLLMGALGKEYIVWDKQADIDYLKPGIGRLVAEFILTDDTVADIIKHTAAGEKYFPQFLVHTKDQNDNSVCEVNRTVYIRKKPKYR